MAQPIQLELLPDPVDPERWRSGCQLTLGLAPPEADRLAAARPLKLHALADADRATRLLAARSTPSNAHRPLCKAHRVVLATERCPKCGEYRACPVCLAMSERLCPRCLGRLRFSKRFTAVRVAVLLSVLLFVALATWSANRRLASWSVPFTIGVYPIDVSEEPSVTLFTSALRPADFRPVTDFLATEGQRYGRDVKTLVTLKLMPPISEQPPAQPQAGASVWDAASFSLQLRWWAFRVKQRRHLPAADVELYVRFHRPSERPDLDASVGLREGHLGVIETEAGARALLWTQLAIVHELMHTLGAPDTYGPSGQPLVPDGLAEPDLKPLFPQKKCEVMAGQVALTPQTAQMAQGLSECRVGDATARAIGWK